MMRTYRVNINELNSRSFAYLNEVFEHDFHDDPEELKHFLCDLYESKIVIIENEQRNDETAAIIKCFESVLEENYQLSLVYTSGKDEITLDIDQLNLGKHDYLKSIFAFPDYYGKNLDALYDCLSESDDLHIRVINLADVNEFSLDVLGVIDDVADEYGNISVSHEYDEEMIDD